VGVGVGVTNGGHVVPQAEDSRNFKSQLKQHRVGKKCLRRAEGGEA
jgi:hypothetical protein